MSEEKETKSVTYPGSPPMAKINGDVIRSLRESKGLTQLYIATMVGVTTDTISRWENRRYPSIKMENAIKLAEALEVELSQILDQAEEKYEEEPAAEAEAALIKSEPVQEQITRKATAKRIAPLLAAFAALLLLGWWFLDRPQTQGITASRVMPGHTPAGEPFPVIIHIDSEMPQPFSLILQETLPKGCSPVVGAPEFSKIDLEKGLLKWISKAETGRKSFAYLARTAPDDTTGRKVILSGQVTLRNASNATVTITGSDSLTIAGYHWADSNRDGTISDEEILAVYDRFEQLDRLGYDWNLIDDIWSTGGYRWDGGSGKYIVLP